MEILGKLWQTYLRWKRGKILKYLCTAPPEELMAVSEKGVLAAFERAAKFVPAYAQRLAELGINPKQIATIDDFRQLAPIVDKYDTFDAHDIEALCLDGNLERVKSILTSSGHSGVFSFGVNTHQNLKTSARSIDLGLDYCFDISHRRTLLINCLPMGVKVHTSVVIAETSVREDMVWAVVKKFSPKFDQTVLVGEGSFLKKVIEDGAEQGIDWKSLCVHIVTGEEGIAENYRTYMAHLVGIDFNTPAQGMIVSSMGIAELDLNIFHETADTIQIRRLAHDNPKFRTALFGECRTCPMFFVYYPHRTYVELATDEAPAELLISMLSPEMKIPLLRYNTKDLGKVFTYQEVQDILWDFGYAEYAPALKLPMVAVFGRGDRVQANGTAIYPEEVKEGLYSDFDVAAAVTGNFKLNPSTTMPSVEIQLKEGLAPTKPLKRKIQSVLASYVLPVPEVYPFPYRSFPYSMTTDYERKFRYVS